ncbi:hypothetical protein RQP53_17835 [Paucibacter sp. APW11]|uniref:Uncharacterized protein n=1 Tax=Roseateles aquae TaxID=3077235 RepID=A0ABU3PEY8_9BURK|nr:hypothetical protein [Paucibacter sp. APW11]MDT9001144.1 hypothetical protein [Paucibacter sp. APW11]
MLPSSFARGLARAAGVLLLSGAALLANSAPLEPPSATPQELKFRDFFKLPIGPAGLEPTARLLALDGQTVRLLAYIVRQNAEDAIPGLVLLAPLPVTLGDEDERYADDLPASVVYAHLPAEYAAHPLPHRPGLVAVSGRLELGSAAEADGRRSAVRLFLDAASAAALQP